MPDLEQEKDAQNTLIRHLPSRWHGSLTTQQGTFPELVRGLGRAFGSLSTQYQAAQKQSIAMLSEGVWLTLHLLSIGLDRKADEPDEISRDRYQWEFRQTRNTRAGMQAWLAKWYGLQAPYLRLETDYSQGKFGQFRIVYDNIDEPWQEVNLSWPGQLLRRFVANGIIPGLNVRVACLLHAPLPPWRYDDQFFESWNLQGPLWERPIFIDDLRLEDARNSFFQVTDTEWRQERAYLRQFHFDARGELAPGAIFVYLTDLGQCPYLLVDFDLQESVDLDDLVPFDFWVDGFRWFDPFDYALVPGFLELTLSDPGILPTFAVEMPSMGSTELPAWDPPAMFGEYFVGAGDTSFAPLIWTQGWVQAFIEVEDFFSTVQWTDRLPRLKDMVDGPWTLTIGEGDPAWGAASPAGDPVPVLNPIATLNPESIWWTNQAGDLRTPRLTVDENGVAYLAVEFLYPKGTERTLREIELKLGDELVHYRRLSLPLAEDENLGIVVKVVAQVGTSSLIEFPAFRAGQSQAGDVLRDRDYITRVSA